MKPGKHIETKYSVADLESSDPLRRSAAYEEFLKPSGILDARNRLDQAWLYLQQQVQVGDRLALEIILTTAKNMVMLLQGPGRALPLDGEALENWESLVKSNSEWPVILSHDRTAQGDKLSMFNEWPLGENHLFKIDKGGRGRRPDRTDGSPSQVGRLIVCKIEGIRNTVTKCSTKDLGDLIAVSRLNEIFAVVELAKRKGLGEAVMAPLRSELHEARERYSEASVSQFGRDSMPTNEEWGDYYETSGDVIQKVRELASYSKESAVEWAEVSSMFLESNSTHRDELIPQYWDLEAPRQGDNGKGRNAHMRKKLKAVIIAQAPE